MWFQANGYHYNSEQVIAIRAAAAGSNYYVYFTVPGNSGNNNEYSTGTVYTSQADAEAAAEALIASFNSE